MSFISRLAGEDEERTVDAVARNLEVVLNAKQGYAGEVEVWGLGCYRGHSAAKEIIALLHDEMLDKIRRFEPRLKNPAVVVSDVDDGLWVQFSIMGTVGGRPCSFSARFHTVIHSVRLLESVHR